MSKKHLITDADGVLVNWNESFNDFMESKGHRLIDETAYAISARYDIDGEAALDYIRYFNNSEHIVNLKPIIGAQNTIAKLHKSGMKITVVTSLSDSPEAKINRTKNLENLFGDVFEEIICLEMGASKTAVLNNLDLPGCFFIEDHPMQAEAGAQAGLRSVLIEHPYNKDYNNFCKFPVFPVDIAWPHIDTLLSVTYRL